MKAIVYEKYGPPDVLQLKEVEKPAPRDNEVLVKIHATTVTIGDTIMRSLNLPISGWQKFMARLILGWHRPKRPILGMELAGEVESIGRKVTRFKPGDPVFASTFAVNFGGHAEYKCLPENGVLALKPANLTYEEAAAVPGGGMTALQCLKKGNIQQRTKSSDLWRFWSGRHVCGTACQPPLRSRSDRGMQRREPGIGEIPGGESGDRLHPGGFYPKRRRPTMWFLTRSENYSPAQGKKALKPGGIYINVHADSDGGDKLENLLFLKELIEAGKIKAVIDRRYPLEHMVEAHRYVEKGHKKGNVVITVN